MRQPAFAPQRRFYAVYDHGARPTSLLRLLALLPNGTLPARLSHCARLSPLAALAPLYAHCTGPSPQGPPLPARALGDTLAWRFR